MWDQRDLNRFQNSYDETCQDRAMAGRGAFLKRFPRTRLSRLTLDEYVTGKGLPTFCNFVESGTRDWALIQGATASKFGIYFGRTSSDPVRKYRFTKRFGNNKDEAFRQVKGAIVQLVRLGGATNLDFGKIDENPLSQLFKAKILSLYFPERFIAVCSRDHLAELARKLGFDFTYTSEIQHRLIEYKMRNRSTRAWSNPKFMRFLYETYLPRPSAQQDKIVEPEGRRPSKVNFDDLQRQWSEIGTRAEEYALEWERNRLCGEGLNALAQRILDCRDRPAYGYDFQSFENERKIRLIEVKALGRVRGDDAYRFFLSENEHEVSLTNPNLERYYFYLVFFDRNKTAVDLIVRSAKELYRVAKMTPTTFEVRFGYSR